MKSLLKILLVCGLGGVLIEAIFGTYSMTLSFILAMAWGATYACIEGKKIKLFSKTITL